MNQSSGSQSPNSFPMHHIKSKYIFFVLESFCLFPMRFYEVDVRIFWTLACIQQQFPWHYLNGSDPFWTPYFHPIEKHRCHQSVKKVFLEDLTLNISMVACVLKCTICSLSRLLAACNNSFHLWFEGTSKPKDIWSFAHIREHNVHNVCIFCQFTSIIYVLELLILNLICMPHFSNAFISFFASREVFEKNTISSAYNKRIMTTFPIATS